MATEIAWTPKLRALVFSTRATPNPTRAIEPIDLDVAWEAALDVSWGGLADWAKPPNSVVVGFASAPPPLAALAKRAHAAIGKRMPELDHEVEAAMCVLDLRSSTDGLALWIAQHGIVFAVRVMIAMTRLRNNEGSSGKHREAGLHLIADGIGAGGQIFDHSSTWHLLREHLAVASQVDYAAARKVADAARRDIPPEARAAIAFVFPDEPWSHDAVGALIEADADDAWESWQMLMATAELDDAIRIAKMEYPMHEEFAMTMLAKHGVETAKIVAAAFDTFGSVGRFATLANALAMIRTREALETFVPMLGISATKTALGRAFKAQPIAGAKILAKIATKSDKAGKAAKAVLAKLG